MKRLKNIGLKKNSTANVVFHHRNISCQWQMLLSTDIQYCIIQSVVVMLSSILIITI